MVEDHDGIVAAPVQIHQKLRRSPPLAGIGQAGEGVERELIEHQHSIYFWCPFEDARRAGGGEQVDPRSRVAGAQGAQRGGTEEHIADIGELDGENSRLWRQDRGPVHHGIIS